MKKYLSVFVLTILIIPSVTFAAWWNPVSWFGNWSFSGNSDVKTQVLENRISELEKKLSGTATSDTPTAIGVASSTQSTKFYVKYDNSRIRSCASTEGCDVVGYYNKNSEITMSGEGRLKLTDLQDWVQINTSSGVSGYISKTVLSETPVTTSVQVKQNVTTDNVTKEPNNTNTSTDFDSSTITVTIDAIISNDSGLIDYAKSEIVNTKANIDYFTQMRTAMINMNNNAPKSVVIGDRYSKIVDAFINELNIDIQYHNNILDYYNKTINILSNNIVTAKNNRELFVSKTYHNKDDMLKDTRIFFNQLVGEQNILNEIHDAAKSSDDNYTARVAYYKQQLLTFKGTLNADSASLAVPFTPPTYIPYVAPVVPRLPVSTVQHCNISPIGGGGVDLVVTCY